MQESLSPEIFEAIRYGRAAMVALRDALIGLQPLPDAEGLQARQKKEEQQYLSVKQQLEGERERLREEYLDKLRGIEADLRELEEGHRESQRGFEYQIREAARLASRAEDSRTRKRRRQADKQEREVAQISTRLAAQLDELVEALRNSFLDSKGAVSVPIRIDAQIVAEFISSLTDLDEEIKDQSSFFIQMLLKTEGNALLIQQIEAETIQRQRRYIRLSLTSDRDVLGPVNGELGTNYPIGGMGGASPSFIRLYYNQKHPQIDKDHEWTGNYFKTLDEFDAISVSIVLTAALLRAVQLGGASQ